MIKPVRAALYARAGSALAWLARKDGKRLGRRPHRITEDDLGRVAHRSQRDAAKALNVPRSVLQRARLARKRTRQQASFAPDLRVSVERDSVAF